MQIMDGKKVAQSVYDELRGAIVKLKKEGVSPKLAVILVGDNAASLTYVKSKLTMAAKIGIECELITQKPDEVTTESLVERIHELNADQKITGILVQLPLPLHVYTPEVLKAISPYKDVDGFTAYNLGKLLISKKFEDLAPCTPRGVLKMLDFYGIKVEGLNAVVVGKSNIVGKPMAMMLLNRRATVTVCHSKTLNLAAHTRNADLLVVAVGRAGLITAEMVKEGAIVIDVGINRSKGNKIVGDIDFDNVAPKCSLITPVPGGCGPMTVACLMENVVIAARRQLQLNP